MTTDDRTMESALAGLSVTAPASLAPSVLADVGLADRYARFDSPIGPLLVAANDRGLCRIGFDGDPERDAEGLAHVYGVRVLRVPRRPTGPICC